MGGSRVANPLRAAGMPAVVFASLRLCEKIEFDSPRIAALDIGYLTQQFSVKWFCHLYQAIKWRFDFLFRSPIINVINLRLPTFGSFFSTQRRRERWGSQRLDLFSSAYLCVLCASALSFLHRELLRKILDYWKIGISNIEQGMSNFEGLLRHSTFLVRYSAVLIWIQE